MGIKAALFDLDGTLLDSMWVWRRVDERSLTARGVALPDDYTRAISAMRMHDAAEYTARRFKLDVEPEALLAEWKAMARDEYAHNVPLKAHARELLELYRKRGVRLGIVSSLTPDLYEPVLTRCGVMELFDLVLSATESPRGKAHPDIYVAAAARLGVRADECVMYDDVPEALCGARAAGMCAVGVYDAHCPNARAELAGVAARFIMDFAEEIGILYRTAAQCSATGR
ncbi:MAG TPA: HAD family phosphatase [Candidatus Fimadaptatus faecigallinarum]|uniref:HAD family phosphatase n=1 Tax=Candidatus Fimadaptatus faecigallinarum TaxID=2840814 RepID=A0A9D1S4L0_9FIRM|nr:HAD family phosphatase [Candidatus Fimadaptatus faecigallinarum]